MGPTGYSWNFPLGTGSRVSYLCTGANGCRIFSHSRSRKALSLSHAGKSEAGGAFCELGGRIQVNAYSLTGESNECIRSWARCLVQNHLASYLGSDAHRLSHRPPKAAAGLAWLYQTMPRQYADALAWGNAHRDLIHKEEIC